MTEPHVDPPGDTSISMGCGIAVAIVVALAGGVALRVLEWPPYSWLVDAQVAWLGFYYPNYTTTLLVIGLFVPLAVLVLGLRDLILRVVTSAD